MTNRLRGDSFGDSFGVQFQGAGTVLIATLVDMVGVLPIFLTGAMALQLRSAIGLEIDTLGWAFAAYFASAAAFAAPVGRLSERIDPAAFLRAGTLLYIVGLFGLSVMGSVPMLIGWAAICGLATSLTRTSSGLLVARGIPPGRQGLALGIRNCAIPGAALLSGLAVSGIALTIGWRWSYRLAAVLCGVVLIALPRSVPRPQRRASEKVDDMPFILVVALAVAVALASTAAVSLGAYTAVTVVDAGISESVAGLLIAASSVVGVTSRALVGWWTDKRTGSQLDMVIGMMVVGGISYGLIATGQVPLLWLAVPIAYSSGWAFYGSYYLSIIRLNPIAPGGAVGVAQSGAFAGSIIGPVALGTLANSYGFAAAWAAATVAVFAAASVTVYVELVVRARAACEEQ